MKAIQFEPYGSPEILQLADVPKPIPKKGEVIVKVYAAAANPLDWRKLRTDPFFARPRTATPSAARKRSGTERYRSSYEKADDLREENTVNTPRNTAIDTRALLSALWILVLFMVYADIITMLTFSWLERVETFQLLDWRVLLRFSVLLEVPIAMTFLSQVLSDGANRWAHTAAVPIFILCALLGGVDHPRALSFATLEVVAMLSTLWLVWQGRAATQLSLTRTKNSSARLTNLSTRG